MSNSAVEKVVWKSAEASFEVIVNSGEVKRWRADKSIPLVDVAQRFEVYTVSDNTLNRASKDELQEAFNTSNVTEAIEHILQHGNIQPLGKEGRRGSVDRSGPELLQAGGGRGQAHR